jgi:type I restriction enzyme S subunit
MRNSGGEIAVRGGAAARSAAGATRRVRLGDVAEEVRENWSGPTADAPVVGLEHIEPDEIWLRKWEVNPDENTFSKAFRKGQLLFGRRRAYQKKLSLAPSDGICSGDITVIAAKSDKVVPSLLPFLLRTDKFFDYAIQGSAGSLSPRVKWAHLAKYEFDLPPMDEQKKLAELLWAANDLKESYKKAITATDEMLKAKFREMFGDTIDSNGTGTVCIGEITELVTKGTTPTSIGFQFEDAGVNFLKAENITDDGRFMRETMMHISRACNDKLRRSQLRVGDYLFSIAGVIGRTAIVDESILPCNTNQAISIIRLKDLSGLDRAFFGALLRSEFVLKQCELQQKQTAQANISLEDVRNIIIPLPSISLQREFVAIADKAESAKANLKKSIAAIDQVMKGLING